MIPAGCNFRAYLQGRLNSSVKLKDDAAERGDFDLNPEWRQRFPQEKLKSAAVLIPIVCRDGELKIIFTERSPHLSAHAGQVSFPGGRIEASDHGPIAAALRESEEEIGLSVSHVDVLGLLDTYQTGTNYIITPVVGIVNSLFEPRINISEVSQIFEVPLHHVLDKSNFFRESRDTGDFTRVFYALYYSSWRIWGATAGMLFNLVERMDVE